MTSPYTDLDPSAFWRSGVAENDPCLSPDFYRPKHMITPKTRVFTAGSCFAQHITRALKLTRCWVLDKEQMIDGLPEDVTRAFGYGMYSARFGNIYTLRQLRQLVEEALGQRTPSQAIWAKGNAYFDALRPSVEPFGLGSPALVKRSRVEHLNAVKNALKRAQVLIFTLGLTECWEHRESGTVYPTAPGVIAGNFDPQQFSFRNLTYEDYIDDFVELRGLLRKINPDLTFILTVSPVPLTATATGQHVLTASAHSKSILRAVCGAIYEADDGVDYFPAYELMTTPHENGHWFNPNLRTPSGVGINRAMTCFLRAHGLAPAAQPMPKIATHDPICEEILLDARAS